MSQTDTTGPTAAGGSTSRAELVREIALSRRDERGPLLEVLRDVVDELGHVDRADVEVVADVLNLSVAEVHGVVSFYADLRTTPPPAHVLRLCRAEACQSVGAAALWDATLNRFAGRDDVEVEEVFCLGNCALGPSGTLDGRLHGRLTDDRVGELTGGWTA